MEKQRFRKIHIEVTEHDWQRMQTWVKYEDQPSIRVVEDCWPHEEGVDAVIVGVDEPGEPE